MTVLAVDTASRDSAWVVTTDTAGVVIDQRQLAGGRLDTLVPAALADVLPASIAAVVVLTGPGSYTGVRGGMAAALGVAAVRGVPLHGLGNLAAVAAAAVQPNRQPFLVIADAGRGGVYCATFETRDGRPVQVDAVQRRTVDELDHAIPVYATTEVPGVQLSRVSPVSALAAAVPLALAAAPLDAAGLAAIHVDGGPSGTGLATNP